MDANDHLIGLGKIQGNLLSLEFSIRVFLCEASGQSFAFPNEGAGPYRETYLTNWDSLGQLIAAYNALMTTSEANLVVDARVVDVRDAIAHGRLIAPLTADYPLTLYRFDRPDPSGVSLKSADVLDMNWLDAKRTMVRDQIEKVVSCAKKRGYRAFR